MLQYWALWQMTVNGNDHLPNLIRQTGFLLKVTPLQTCQDTQSQTYFIHQTLFNRDGIVES